MTLDGIGGLKPGDMFRVDYLPKVYRDFAYFQIFQINHSMGTSGWETKITAQMKLDLTKMKNEGYIQETEPRDFDLETITEAMRALNGDKTKLFQDDETNNNGEAAKALVSQYNPFMLTGIYWGTKLAQRIAAWYQGRQQAKKQATIDERS
tara:strand:- start:68 stop:520 length:453 start_codon:yes stop_codon:yes gene_type:complete